MHKNCTSFQDSFTLSRQERRVEREAMSGKVHHPLYRGERSNWDNLTRKTY